MKKLFVVLLTVASMLFSSVPVEAVAGNEPVFVETYARGYLYCNNSVGLTAYQGGQIYDNNASCIDPSDMIMANPTGWWETIMEAYPGGLHRWRVTAGGQHCMFDVYQASPIAGEFVAAEIVFAACAVRLGKPVTPEWYISDYEDPSITPITLDDATLSAVNEAVAVLNKEFRRPFALKLVPRRGSLNVVVKSTPAGSKLRLQKWVDYKWVTVRTWERYNEGKATYTYPTQSGRYRISATSIAGAVYVTKSVGFK